jgi:uncharacterized cupin superfamily protein
MSADRTDVPGFALSVADAVLEPVPLDPSQVVAGAPEVSELVLSESDDGRVVRGIWQMTPGVVTDTEVDELFVVHSGRATIEFADGTVRRRTDPLDRPRDAAQGLSGDCLATP